MLTPFMTISSQSPDPYRSSVAVGSDSVDSISIANREIDRNESVTRTQVGNRTETDENQQDSVELSPEAEEIRQLQSRDQEVRAHEAAHAAAGGAFAGSPTYTTKRGPDGKTYVTGGEVNIDMSPVKGNPEATLKKAEQVRAAALAPVQPSSQDMRVAQKAQTMAAKARADIAEGVAEKLTGVATNGQDSTEEESASDKGSVQTDARPTDSSAIEASEMARLSAYA